MRAKDAKTKGAHELSRAGEPRRLAITSIVVGGMACATIIIALVLARLAGNFARPILIFAAGVCFACGVAAIILGYITRARMRKIAAQMDRLGIRKSPLRIKTERRSLAGMIMGCFGVVAPFLLVITSAGFFRAERGYGANDAKAIDSLRAIHSANSTYFQTCGQSFASRLRDLGPPESGGAANCRAASLIDHELVSGRKLGYHFTYIIKHVDSAGKIDGYSLRADPVIRGMTGQRSFYTDESGVIRSSATGVATGGNEPIE